MRNKDNGDKRKLRTEDKKLGRKDYKVKKTRWRL